MSTPNAAPVAAAPAASAAPVAAPAAAAPAAPASAGGMFDDLAITEKAPVQEPEMDMPMGEPGQKKDEPKPAAEVPPVEEGKPEAKPAAEAAPVTEPAKKLWAEQFEKPEELEVAYQHSSKEGRRLAGVVKEKDTTISALQAKVREFETQIALGPEIQEPTDEQLEAMGPIQAARTLAKLSEQKLARQSLKEKRDQTERQALQESQALEASIKAAGEKMAADPARFPEYEQMVPMMGQMLDFEPGIAGHKNTPVVLFLAAHGLRALEGKKAAKAAADKAAADAKLKALSDAAPAGGSGAPGGTKTPAGEAPAIDPNSDEAHNLAIIRGGRKNAMVFPGI